VSLIEFVLIPYGVLDYNLGINLISESIGIVLTVVFLIWLVALREKREWANVEELVEKRIGRYLYILFEIFARLIYNRQFSSHPRREEILKILRALNDMKEANLNEDVYNYYFPKPLDDFSAQQLDRPFRWGRRLSDLEIRYFRFIKPEIHFSLMKIQSYLNAIETGFALVKMFDSREEVAKKEIARSILGTMKQIYRIHKMGIEINPFQEPSAEGNKHDEKNI